MSRRGVQCGWWWIYGFLCLSPIINSYKDSEQVDVEKCADGLFGAPDRCAECLVDVFLVVDV